MNSILDNQIAELKKWSFDTLLALARSEEPLTYALKNDQGEYQFEVFFTDYNDNLLHMVIALDSNGRARFEELPEGQSKEAAIERVPNDVADKIVSLDNQIAELKKWSFDTLLALARSEEPLTYALKNDQGEYQFEVEFSNYDKHQLNMIVSLDSGSSRFRLFSKDEVKEVAIERV